MSNSIFHVRPLDSGIGWPEDKEPVKKLERALEYLGAPHRPVSGADAACTEAV